MQKAVDDVKGCFKVGVFRGIFKRGFGANYDFAKKMRVVKWEGYTISRGRIIEEVCMEALYFCLSDKNDTDSFAYLFFAAKKIQKPLDGRGLNF